MYTSCRIASGGALRLASTTSRVAGSLNHHLGMEAMNAADDESFVAHAIRLGNDPEALPALRKDLAQRRDRPGGLFDMTAFAEGFAAAARKMWTDRSN